jgi:predicted amidohydrolase
MVVVNSSKDVFQVSYPTRRIFGTWDCRLRYFLSRAESTSDQRHASQTYELLGCFAHSTTMNINALIAQFPVSFSIPRNLEIIDSILEQTNVGDLVIFPEGSISGYSTDTSFLKQINSHALMNGIKHLQAEAEKRKINVWAGACVNADNKWFNAAYGFSADGKMRVYHKINLANHERGVFSAGNSLPIFELNILGEKIVIGVQICRELRFPEQWGWLARCGAQIILHLNNAIGDSLYQPVWRSHLVSRAAEAQRFVLSANNAATQQVSPTIAIAPDGHIIGEVVSPKLDVLHVELDLSKVSNWYLSQSRIDIVEIRSSHNQNAA